MRTYLDLIWYKVYAELSAEAARTWLGILWWVIEPVLYMSVFYLIFGIIFQQIIDRTRKSDQSDKKRGTDQAQKQDGFFFRTSFFSALNIVFDEFVHEFSIVNEII